MIIPMSLVNTSCRSSNIPDYKSARRNGKLGLPIRIPVHLITSFKLSPPKLVRVPGVSESHKHLLGLLNCTTLYRRRTSQVARYHIRRLSKVSAF